LVVVFTGLAVLSWQSYSNDARDEKYHAALVTGNEQADRAKELAAQGIPAGGALVMLRDDPKTQGPRLFRQHCLSCHDSKAVRGSEPYAGDPSAPSLDGFATRDWVRGWCDAKQIVSPAYFGNTKFKKGQMVDYVKNGLKECDPEEIEAMVLALSAEAALPGQRDADAKDAAKIAEGKSLLADNCTDCHTFHGKGTVKGTDMTGYGSRDWLIGIIRNPAHARYYGKENDRMPAYAESTDPSKNILTDHEIGMLADWLRGQW